MLVFSLFCNNFCNTKKDLERMYSYIYVDFETMCVYWQNKNPQSPLFRLPMALGLKLLTCAQDWQFVLGIRQQIS